MIKQRLQVYSSPYQGVRDCITKVYRHEGISAFYRSFTTQLFMNLPMQCTHLVTYEFLRQALNPSGEYHPQTHLVAGAGAGAMAAAFTNPLDVAKTLLNTQEPCAGAQAASQATMSSRRYVVGVMGALKMIYKENGLLGYTKGMKARVLTNAPACAVSWSVYEFFKHILLWEKEKERK